VLVADEREQWEAHVRVHTGDYGHIVVDDPVHDRVQDRHRPTTKQVRAGFKRATHRGEIGRLAVADRDHEMRPCEDVHFPELDGLGLVDVPSRPQHAEQRVPVTFELRSLVSVYGVLDGQLVKPELLGNSREFLLGRPIQANPCDPATRPARLVHIGEVARLGRTAAVAIDGPIDDHAVDAIPTSVTRESARRS
jgi:hypothetical protein